MKQLPALPAEAELLIETDRLRLTPLLREDAQSLFSVLSDPALYKYTGEVPPESVGALGEAYASREARMSPDRKELWFNWAVRERTSNEPVGYMQASVAATHADVAWVVGSKWQRRGYASETARAIVQWLFALGVLQVRAQINPRHLASRKVAINAGLQRTDDVADGEEVWILAWDYE